MDDPIVVSADWLVDRLDEVRIVDVREPWEYEGIGHLPGAVNVPFDEFRGGGEVGMLPPAERWADLLGEAGITADDAIVAYDDTHGVFAARFLVTAHLFGHRRLHLLDGDYSAWMQRHETSTEPPDVEPTTYEVPGLSEEASPLVDADAVEAAAAGDAILVDTRSAEEFGEGHIPGAVNLDWRELVDDDGRGLKPRGELLATLDAKGIVSDRRIVLYCNTARRISHTYLVLRHLGYEDVDFYEGSLTEWLDEDRAIETTDPE